MTAPFTTRRRMPLAIKALFAMFATMLLLLGVLVATAAADSTTKPESCDFAVTIDSGVLPWTSQPVDSGFGSIDVPEGWVFDVLVTVDNNVGEVDQPYHMGFIHVGEHFAPIEREDQGDIHTELFTITEGSNEVRFISEDGYSATITVEVVGCTPPPPQEHLCPEGYELVAKSLEEPPELLPNQIVLIKAGRDHYLVGENPPDKEISHYDVCETDPPPTTEPPTTEPPTTEPPVTEPPTTEPPVTEPPVTEPPTTEPPVTEPPTTEPPTTEPPTTEPPVVTTVPPVVDTRPPTTEAPTTEPEPTDNVEPGPELEELPRTGGTTDLALLGLVLLAGGSTFLVLQRKIRKGDV